MHTFKPLFPPLVWSLLALISTAHAGPMGPSAEMAARLKKYPTSAWLAHYLPDDRYKIAGGVWKYVSTDLDTYYHLPNSSLMISQPAGHVIGFSSVAEAEEAGYRPGPSVQPNMRSLGGKSGMAGSNPRANAELRKALAALAELQALGTQMQTDRSHNLPMIKQRLQRALVLFNDIPVNSGQVRQASSVKSLLRGLIKTIDLQMAGNSGAARRQLSVSVASFQSQNR